MSAITVENDLVHYEVLGRGRPVILLHGWLGSWRYWVPAMQQLSMKYRTYALDFWGFGDSGRDTRRYDFPSQVMLLDQFMERMGISKAALVGHDLGAAVAARYAIQHPDRVPRLMVVSPPLFWMAPRPAPLTSDASAAPQLPAGASPSDSGAERSGPESAQSPAAPPKPGLPVNPEAETMPWRTDEMKARIQATMERRARELGEARQSSAMLPKPPRDAATPPTDKPVREVGAPSAAPLPASMVPVPPSPDSAPDSSAGQVQRANPLKQHLETLDRAELLKRHVDAGPDQEKLRVEVEKADTVALAMSVDSFADVDTLRDLRALAMPTVMVYGLDDTFLPQPDVKMFASLSEGQHPFHTIPMESIRHFPMLENIAGFTRLVLDFLEVPDVTKLAIKETWERRVR
jgi:pimeloyl-ACP methyl ester carboxylesterase